MARRHTIPCISFGNRDGKYHAHKTTIDGITFDSRHEAERYAELALLKKAGQISDLRMQVKFILIPTQREPDARGPRGGITKGKLLEKECAYYADFVYTDKYGRTIVEDAKSPATRTEAYKIKKKLMLQMGYQIKEV
jgi:hypothetical protein